jgi:ERCC4-related helicase
MGRTARFRNGKVIILIQEGEEEEKIMKSKINS